MPTDLARLVWLWRRHRAVAQRGRLARQSQGGTESAPKNVPTMALLSHPAEQHGHGVGQERPGTGFALCRTGERCAAAQAVSYTHLRAHETDSYLVCRLLL